MENMKTTSPHIDYIRRVWVTAVLLCCLLLVATVSAAEESDTTPVSADNGAVLEAASNPHGYMNYTGSDTCLGCHGEASTHGDVSGFLTSVHYTWMGTATNVVGKEGNEIGKLTAINDFCGAITSNEALCGKCHAGYGLPEYDFSAGKIDCLICHAPDYKKTATGPDPSVDAKAAAKNVTLPTREMCLRCHATAGGGDNNKRGDVELGMKSDLELATDDLGYGQGDLDAAMGTTDVPKNLDVHMNLGMKCQDCHTFEDHHVSGRGMDLRIDDTNTTVSCTNCHNPKPHSESSAMGSFLNSHTDRIGCTVCHITSYGKEATVEMSRDWEHRSLGSNGMHNENIVRESNPAPIQVWWNRKSEIVDLADPVTPGPDGTVVLAEPVGSINDPDSKIYAARLHHGRQPWNGTYLLPFQVMTVKKTDNMTQAIFNATGTIYDPVQYVNTSRYMGIFHGVAPKEDALTCSDCHSDHKLDFEALGYNVKKDASGKLISATRPGDDTNLATLEGFSHASFIPEYKGAETCLKCHRKEGEDFKTSIHYTWKGKATHVVGKEGMMIGKRTAINDFCGAIKSNEDTVCGKCHAGYGLPTHDFSVEKIDCLICHAPNYKKTPTGPDPSINATLAARNVTLPTREMCLRCHATAGGGDANRLGDLELGLMSDTGPAMDSLGLGMNDLEPVMGTTAVTKDTDVHMGAGMRCQDCHTFVNHHVSGRGMDLRVDDTNITVSCENCHTSKPHVNGSAVENTLNNMHTDRLACTVCHVTAYGKETTAELSRDWEHRVVPTSGPHAGWHVPSMVRGSNVAPTQVWWNRMSDIKDITDPVVLNADGVFMLAKPVGSINDSASKIYAARLHHGRQPWDGTYLLPFRIMTILPTDNMTKAVLDATGKIYDPVQYVNTARYSGTFHEVAKKEDALKCIDCHDRSHHKLDFEALGYTVTKDASGKLISATIPGSIAPNLATLAEGAAGPGTGEAVSVNISSWTLPSTGTRGTSISVTANIANTGTETNWFVVSISGTQPTTGYPIVGTGTVRLDAGESAGVPVRVSVPGSADTGSYTLTPAIYKLDEYPAGNPKAMGSGKSVTIS